MDCKRVSDSLCVFAYANCMQCKSHTKYINLKYLLIKGKEDPQPPTSTAT